MDSVEKLYRFARRYLPGGVCASARANEAIGHPFYVSHGDGARVYDLDGREVVIGACPMAPRCSGITIPRSRLR